MYKKILIVGPCRSGTTFLLNALSNDQYVGIFQRVKSGIRHELKNGFPVNSTTHRQCAESTFVAKESFGPYFQEEVFFDPIAQYLSLTPALDELIVFAIRAPDECYMSWIKSFSSRWHVDSKVFNAAYTHLYTLYLKYKDKKNIVIFPLNKKTDCLEKLSVIKRKMMPVIRSSVYKEYIKYKDPEFFEVKGLLDKAMNSKFYSEEKTKIKVEIDAGIVSEAHMVYMSMLKGEGKDD